MLIYASHPILGYQEEPAWVQSVSDHVSKKQHVLYRPRKPFSDMMQNKFFVEAMQKEPRPYVTQFGVPSDVVVPLEQLIDDFERDDLHDILVFRDLYVLSRADLIIIDGNNPTYGGTAMETMLASQIGVPSILVSDRTVPGPWMRSFTDMTTSSHEVLKIVDMWIAAQSPVIAVGYQAQKAAEENQPKPKARRRTKSGK